MPTTNDHPEINAPSSVTAEPDQPDLFQGALEPLESEQDSGRDWRGKPEQLWTAFDRSEAYADTRPVGGHYDPALDYGHPDFREPESDAEAAARLAHLEAERAAHPPPTLELREYTEVEDALFYTGLDAANAERAHDPDPALEARARALEALDRLAPLPPEIAHELEELEHDEEEQYADECDEEEL